MSKKLPIKRSSNNQKWTVNYVSLRSFLLKKKKIESEEYILDRTACSPTFWRLIPEQRLVARYLSFKYIKSCLSTLIARTDNSLTQPIHLKPFQPTWICLFAIDISRVLTKRSHPARNYARFNEELRHVPIEPLLTATSSPSSSLFLAQRLARWHVLTWWVWTAARVLFPTVKPRPQFPRRRSLRSVRFTLLPRSSVSPPLSNREIRETKIRLVRLGGKKKNFRGEI